MRCARDHADRRTSSLCTTFNLPIEDQARVYDGSVTLVSLDTQFSPVDVRTLAGDDACEALISVPPRALD
jgi:hypothetical protein